MARETHAGQGEILFLSHRIPFPPDRGDKIRSFHVLHALARIAPVHVATFADDGADRRSEPDLATLAASHCLVDRRSSLALAGIGALLSRRPVSLAAFDDARLRAYVAQVIETRPIAAIYVFSGQMAQYVPDRFGGRVVMDFVDVDSAKFEAYGRDGSGFRGWIDRREGRLLSQEEARIARRADVSLLISDAEAALFRARLPDRATGESVHVLGNGIDSALFDPATCLPAPEMAAITGPRLIFTGQMDYAPNIAAAKRAIERIVPLVRRTFPDASFHIVGREPAASLRGLHGSNGVYVWGRVDDIRPWLAAADIALVPLDIARGVQNKVLEAMSMQVPVVLTRGAAAGIAAPADAAFVIRDDDSAIAQAICELMRDDDARREMGACARRWVRAHAAWGPALARLGSYLGVQGVQGRGSAGEGRCDARG